MQPKLQSKLSQQPLGLDLDLSSEILCLGSCFAENIGYKLEVHKFNCRLNPLGISYNPLSLFNLMLRSLKGERFDKKELRERDGRVFSFELHSSFSNADPQQVIKSANQALEQQAENILNADCIFISLGTAWVHVLTAEDRLVNNCHKLPAAEFKKGMLSIEDIIEAWEALYELLQKERSNMPKIVFTVSPIRHLKDGFRENQLSKSTLHLAVDQICQINPNISYFPSYEFMMDELRDYRFYARDLVHPNELAIDLIWEHFQKTCVSSKGRKQIEEWKKLKKALEHSAFDPEHSAHQDFLKKLKKQLIQFERAHAVSLKAELSSIEDQIKKN